MWGGSCILRYGDDIYNAATGKVPPEQVCAAIDLCSSAALPAEAAVDQAQSGVACLLCEIVLEQIAAHENMTFSELQAELEQACTKFPSLKRECDALVVLWGADIFNAITGGIPAGVVCDVLHICQNASGLVGGNIFTCSVCEYIFEQSAEDLPSEFTLTVLQGWLTDICNHLGSKAEECNALAVLFGKYVYDALVGEIPSWTTCKVLNMCPKQNTTKPTGNLLECEVCEFVLREVATYLPESFSVDDLSSVLIHACLDVHGAEADCNAISVLFSQEIYNVLVGMSSQYFISMNNLLI